jgi:hypothetical protein
MIRKPTADWQFRDEGAAVRTVRTASAIAQGSAKVARCGVQAMRGVLCYCFALLWGFAAIIAGLAGSLPSFIGVGAMSALMFWIGTRAFAKARAMSS